MEKSIEGKILDGGHGRQDSGWMAKGNDMDLGFSSVNAASISQG